ncbi:MAG: TldD/PmbA family protein [Deltaproteobacteria bacterium]|nr:TldD/PmbA family protein [Deltaproteobacteria bacterium]
MQTEGQTKRLLERVIMLASSSKGTTATATLRGTDGGNTRFAVNEITSSSDVELLTLSVNVGYGKRSATATTNQLDDRSIDDVVARASRMARLAPENPEAMPPLDKQKYITVKGARDGKTVELSPSERAKAAFSVISAGDAAKVQIAGYYEHASKMSAIASSEGLWAFHAWSSCGLSCTARTKDATGSGWANAASNRAADIDAAAVAKVAVDKAVSSAKARRLEPGRYTVILEPAAVANLTSELAAQLGARSADEGRSFFSKPGGGTRVGETLFPNTITLRTDPTDTTLAASPFDGEGVPLKPTRWIDKGKLTALTYGRYWAKKQGVAPTGSPDGWVLEGGKATREELIKGVKRGVLITRFWYIRSLDPQTILLTGLTRDGTFLIENGAIVAPVMNFRFNESPVHMLTRADAMTPTVVTRGMRAPALRTHDFNLASISEAV